MGEFSDAFNSMTRMLKEREERNLEKQRSLMRLFNKLNIIIAVLNGEDKSILFINEMAERFIMEIGGPDADNETRVGLFTSLLIENLPASNGTSVFFENNLNRWYQIESTDIEWQDGNPAVLCSISDVSMMKIKEESLRAIAEIDSLTGLYRRDAGITKFFSVMAEIREKNYIVLFIDIDNFKEINDKYGHQSGDKALVSISGALKRSLRDTDVIIRWGGDEFVCILTGSGQSSADVVITRINAKLDGVNKGARLPYRLLLSIGISSPSEDADEIFSRIEEADHKMYLAKNEKKTSLEI